MNFNPISGISGSSPVAVTSIPKHKSFILSNTSASTATIVVKFMKPDGNGTDDFSIKLIANSGALFFPTRLHSIVSTTQQINVMFLR